MYVMHVWQGIFDDAGVEHVEVMVRLSRSEADALVANYDPASGTSPGVSDCRPIVRAILDKIKEVRGV